MNPIGMLGRPTVSLYLYRPAARGGDIVDRLPSFRIYPRNLGYTYTHITTFSGTFQSKLIVLGHPAFPSYLSRFTANGEFRSVVATTPYTHLWH